MIEVTVEMLDHRKDTVTGQVCTLVPESIEKGMIIDSLLYNIITLQTSNKTN